MPRSALRLAVGIGAATAALAGVGTAAAAVTTFPGSYREGPTLSVGSASGRVWFAAYALPTTGGDPSSLTAPSRISGAKVVKGNLKSVVTTSLGMVGRYSNYRQAITGNQLVIQRGDFTAFHGALGANGRVGKLAPIVNPPHPIMDAALVGKKLVVIGGQNIVVCCDPAGAPVGLGAVQGGFANDVNLKRDKGGRLWAAWDGYAGFGAAGTTARMQQLNPTTLQPIGAIQVAPVTYAAGDAPNVDLICAATCRMVFTKGNSVLSWKPGEAKATTIVRTTSLYVGAAMTSSGKVVTAYLSGNKLQVRRGTATGAGGKVKKVTLKTGNYGNGATALVGSRLAVGMAYSKTGDVWRAVGTMITLP